MNKESVLDTTCWKCQSTQNYDESWVVDNYWYCWDCLDLVSKTLLYPWKLINKLIRKL